MGMFTSVAKSLDNTLAKHVDEDEFFESQKAFIFHYTRTIGAAGTATSTLCRTLCRGFISSAPPHRLVCCALLTVFKCPCLFGADW